MAPWATRLFSRVDRAVQWWLLKALAACCVDWEAEEAAAYHLRRLEAHQAEVEEMLESVPTLQELYTGEWTTYREELYEHEHPVDVEAEDEVLPLVPVAPVRGVKPKKPLSKRSVNRARRRILEKIVNSAPPDSSKPEWDVSKTVKHGSASQSELAYAMAHAAKAHHPNIVLNNTEANRMVLRRFYATLRKEHDIRNADFNAVLPLALVLAFVPLQVDIDAARIEGSSPVCQRVQDEQEGFNLAKWWSPRTRTLRA